MTIRIGAALLACLPWSVTPAAAGALPFAEPVTIDATFTGLGALAVTDVDGNGERDVIGASETRGEIVWWAGAGDTTGPWVKTTVDPAFAGASWPGATDLDRDGDTDVFCAAREHGTLAWFENTAGNGSAWARHDIDTEFAGITSVRVIDADRDGDGDLVGVGRTAGAIAWWDNTSGDGSTWIRRTIASDFHGAAWLDIGDVDGDGAVDLLAAARETGGISWFRNPVGAASASAEKRGAPEAWPENPIATLPAVEFVLLVDLDGDGQLEALATAPPDVRLFELNGDLIGEATLSSSRLGVPQAGDPDRDGDLEAMTLGELLDYTFGDEIVISEPLDALGDTGDSLWVDLLLSGLVDVLEQSQASGLVLHPGASTRRNAVFDDRQDLATSPGVQKVLVSGRPPGAGYNSSGSGREVEDVGGRTYHGFSSLAGFVDADPNGDGEAPDFVVVSADPEGDGLVLYERETTAPPSEPISTWTPRTIDEDLAGARDAVLADVDLDGDTDVVGCSLDIDLLGWWENENGDGATWIRHEIDPAFEGVIGVEVADVDRDGDADVLGAAFAGGELAWYENTAGDGTVWTISPIVTAFSGAHDVTVADTDGDGDVDVVGAAFIGGRIDWFENTDGSGTAWTSHEVDPSFAGASELRVADMDRDGDADIVAVALTAGDVAWYDNLNGNGTAWTRHDVDTVVPGAIALDLGDPDQDGDLDIVVAAFDSGRVLFYENAGTSSFFFKYTIDGAYDGATDVGFVDVDRDGDQDIVGAATNAGRISWWPNVGGQFRLSTFDTAPTTLASRAADDLLRIDLGHNGRIGDDRIELTSLALRFEDAAGDPLTPPQANTLISRVRVHRDDGSLAFDPVADDVVAELTTLSPVDGIQVVSFADGDPRMAMDVGPPNRYFVALELGAGAVGAVDGAFRVTHLAQAATAENAVHDTGLRPQLTDNVSSSAVEPLGCTGDALRLLLTDPQNTRLDWQPEAGVAAYDVIRGLVSRITRGGGAVSLGAVTCIENDSADTTTGGGNLDSETPASGEAFLYLVRSAASAPEAAYGRGVDCTEARVADAGDCP